MNNIGGSAWIIDYPSGSFYQNLFNTYFWLGTFLLGMRSRMFDEQQISALADYIRAALMLKYNGRRVG